MRRLFLPLIAALSLLAACSSGDALDARDDADTTAEAEHAADTPDAGDHESAEAPVASDDVDDAAAADGAVGDDATVHPASRAAGRRVIRTAEIELVSDDADETHEEVLRLADRAGGYVATTDLRRDDDDLLRGTLTLRVPTDDLLGVLRDLEALAVRTPVSRIDEHDVTDETSDLEARLTNLTTYEQELRSLLADVREDTSAPDDLLRIFERIREVRAEIDTAEGRLASLDDQVELATVTVHLDPARTAQAVADPTWQPSATAQEALTAALRGLGRVTDGLIWLVVGVLPVVLVVAIPGAGLVLAWRRRRIGDVPTGPGSPPASDPAT